MPRTDQIEEYLAQVCGQIRWKRAHPDIRQELQQHLLDQADAFEKDGLEAEQAAAEAIREMGDPVLVGTQLDRSYRPKFNWPILIIALLLAVFGMIARWMMCMQVDSLFSIADCVCTIMISAIVLFVVMKVDYTIFSRTRLIYAGYLVGILAVSFMSETYSIGMLLPPYFLITAAPVICCSLIYKFRDGGLGNVWLCCLLTLLPMPLLSERVGVLGVLLFSGFAVVLTLMTAVLTGLFSHLRHRGAAAASLLCLAPISIGLLWLEAPYEIQHLAASLILKRDPKGYGYIVLTVRSILAKAKWVGPIADYSEAAVSIKELDFLLTWMVCRFGWISLIGVFGFALTLLLFVVRSYRAQKGLLAKLMLCVAYRAPGSHRSYFLLR